MASAPRPSTPHDVLVRYAFGRAVTMAILLRHVLPAKLLACLDLDSLRDASTIYATPLLVRRESDLLFTIDLVGAEARSIFLALEHQSTRDVLLPMRALLYAGDIWHRHVGEVLPRPTSLPFVLPVVLAQARARTTPTRLTQILDVPPSLRDALGVPIELELLLDDLSGSVLHDPIGEPAFVALVEIARFLLFAHDNPRAIEDPRLARMPELFDLVLKRLGPDDVLALWRYVVEVFDPASPIRAILVQSATHAVKEVYMTIADSLRAEGRAEGRAAAKAEVLLDMLEHRDLLVPTHLRERVLSTHDEPLLQRWLRRAFAATSLDEIFEG